MSLEGGPIDAERSCSCQPVSLTQLTRNSQDTKLLLPDLTGELSKRPRLEADSWQIQLYRFATGCSGTKERPLLTKGTDA